MPSRSLSDGGLYVPEYGMEEAAISASLKQIDPDLILIKPGTLFASRPEQERWDYRVYRKVGGDREPEFVCGCWDDYGNPRPLSSWLIEKVKESDKNTRGRRLDELAREELRKQDVEKRTADAIEGATDTWVPKHGRPVLHRGRDLLLSRIRARRAGKANFG